MEYGEGKVYNGSLYGESIEGVGGDIGELLNIFSSSSSSSLLIMREEAVSR